MVAQFRTGKKVLEFLLDDEVYRLGLRVIADGEEFFLENRSFGRSIEPRRVWLVCGNFNDAIWLILPVVICLSQRLSHAGLSPCRIKVRPRMAHYISYGSLDFRLHLDNPGNSRANTCIPTPTLGKVCFY
jgi:hypothetical protein